MKISLIRIENILGIKELELTPGNALTEISGDNGLGKTSVLEAIKAATGGGHDASLLRKGAEKGEIVLVLDDGTELHKRITQHKSTLDLYEGGKKVARPTERIKGLTDLMSVNPVEFLTAPKKDRVRVLLEAMPITVDGAKLEQITGIPVSSQPDVPGLMLVDLVRKQVFDDRTGTNRAVTEKEGTINQLSLAMPEIVAGAEGNEDELNAALLAARATQDAETKRIDEKLGGIRAAHNDALTALRATSQAEIDALKAKLQTEIDEAEAKLKGIEEAAGRQRTKAVTSYASTVEPINITLSAIRTNRSAIAKRAQAKDTIKLMEGELADLRADAARQTKALEDIDQYKSDLLASLPIPGLEVIDGEVFRDGVAFDRLNTAQQVEIAIEIAKLRAGDLPVCCFDRFESLSPATLEEFKTRAEASGLQLFVTRVSDGDLTINAQ